MYLVRNTNYSIEVHTMFMVDWPDIWQQINVCDFQLLSQHFLIPNVQNMYPPPSSVVAVVLTLLSLILLS